VVCFEPVTGANTGLKPSSKKRNKRKKKKTGQEKALCGKGTVEKGKNGGGKAKEKAQTRRKVRGVLVR